jgi:hypothetical protein
MKFGPKYLRLFGKIYKKKITPAPFFWKYDIFIIKNIIMKKIVRLTESDLMRLVKRVIKENQNELDDILNGLENTLEQLEFRGYSKPNVSKLSVMQKYENFNEKLILSDLPDEIKDEYRDNAKNLFKKIFRYL